MHNVNSSKIKNSSTVPYIRIIHSFSIKGNIFYREQFQNQANLLIYALSISFS